MCIYIYIYVNIHTPLCVYIYIYIERDVCMEIYNNNIICIVFCSSCYFDLPSATPQLF